jgi:hypothetical protein
VFCYNDAWWLYMRIGVFSEVYPSDFALLSDDDARRQAEFLREHPDTIVIMRQAEYERLFGASEGRGQPNTGLDGIERIGRGVLSWVSSVHFSYVQSEMEAVARRVDRTVGVDIRRHWRRVRTFGEFVVLEGDHVMKTGQLVETGVASIGRGGAR